DATVGGGAHFGRHQHVLGFAIGGDQQPAADVSGAQRTRARATTAVQPFDVGGGVETQHQRHGEVAADQVAHGRCGDDVVGEALFVEYVVGVAATNRLEAITGR